MTVLKDEEKSTLDRIFEKLKKRKDSLRLKCEDYETERKIVEIGKDFLALDDENEEEDILFLDKKLLRQGFIIQKPEKKEVVEDSDDDDDEDDEWS